MALGRIYTDRKWKRKRHWLQRIWVHPGCSRVGSILDAPTPRGQTDAYEKITFPHTTYAVGNFTSKQLWKAFSLSVNKLLGRYLVNEWNKLSKLQWDAKVFSLSPWIPLPWNWFWTWDYLCFRPKNLENHMSPKIFFTGQIQFMILITLPL